MKILLDDAEKKLSLTDGRVVLDVFDIKVEMRVSEVTYARLASGALGDFFWCEGDGNDLLESLRDSVEPYQRPPAEWAARCVAELVWEWPGELDLLSEDLHPCEGWDLARVVGYARDICPAAPECGAALAAAVEAFARGDVDEGRAQFDLFKKLAPDADDW